MNTNGYDSRQISKGARFRNFIYPCKVTKVNPESKEVWFQVPFKSKEEIRISPSNFEIETYEVGEFCDLILGTMNGMVQRAQLLSKTPPAFCPQE